MAKKQQTLNKSKIAGYEKEVAQLQQLKEFLLDADKYEMLGISIPKGVLLYGPPGVGKTVMAKSIADERINVVELRAADCTTDNSAQFITEAFAKAKESKPAILLIDEFDKIAGGNSMFYMEKNDVAMKVLLQELDLLEAEIGVLVVATCNDYRSLGPALVRSGRFDRVYKIDWPSQEDRKKILNLYFDKITLDKNIDIDYVARATMGYSGAELECLVNESAIIAIERKQSKVDFACFQTAMNRMAFHSVESSVNEKEKHYVAVHEAGHAIVALYLKPDSLSTATIIPHGQVKGHTAMLVDDDYEVIVGPKIKQLDDVAIALGGRIAEIIEFGESSCGCEKDMMRAINSVDFIMTQSGKYGYEYLISQERRSADSMCEEQKKKIYEKRVEILNELHEEVKNIILEHKAVFNEIVCKLEEKHILSREDLLNMKA